ncbi:MAG: fluoride efflux transporter CrcB [Crocinitomicaceae bacterium]|nr:fluoride efflux transporter CrcB [Crocinitomicaceae bacterium]MDG1776555.1 fluoride efflux transporter CrcB [Crocinitomicaceae bacterium]
MVYLYIFIGGGLGSLVRYIITRFSNQMISIEFPLGTFISNMLACLLLVVLVASFSSKQAEYEWVQPLLIIGFCGGFSTFSTFSNETFNLFESGHSALAILNILISVSVGIGLIFFLRSRA